MYGLRDARDARDYDLLIDDDKDDDIANYTSDGLTSHNPLLTPCPILSSSQFTILPNLVQSQHLSSYLFTSPLFVYGLTLEIRTLFAASLGPGNIGTLLVGRSSRSLPNRLSFIKEDERYRSNQTRDQG
jgi:hypothetical protein